MGELVRWELQYVAVVITTGVFLSLVYDAVRIIRRIIPHNIFWMSLEDIIFWMFAAIVTFVVCFIEDAGNIRWFAICGEVLGAVLYNATVGPFLVKYISIVINFPVRLIKNTLKMIFKWFTIKDTE